MKKKLVMLICLFLCFIGTQAQNDTAKTLLETRNDTVMTVLELQQTSGPLNVCTNRYQRVVVYTENCSEIHWSVNGINYDFDNNPMIFDSQVNYVFVGGYNGCGIGFEYAIVFQDPNVPSETTTELWKHQYETITLEAVGADSANMYTYFWPHNGATTPTVEVTSQGNYQCLISDVCATAVRTKIVKENVEIDLATCDLESNLNLITWQTNPAQAQYIDHVVVKRDGLQVGTANYSDGQFTDNIGSGSASRTYTLTAMDGTECPIVSYPKETIHMAYLTGMNNTIEVNWNVPTGYDLMGYNICEWNANDGTLTTIDYVGASVTSYTCLESAFDQGYIVVQGVEAGKDAETRLLSNRSQETVGIGENGAENGFKVYPNPANSVLFVETVCTPSLPQPTEYRILNPIGQTVMQGAITSEKQQIDVRNLPNGMYFITIGGVTRKFVVE